LRNKGGAAIIYRYYIKEMRHLGKWLQTVEPMVLVCFALLILILAVRFLPLSPLHSVGLGDQDKDRITLVRLYYTYWNDEGIHKLIRLNAEQSQIQIPIADPVETLTVPELYQEQLQKNTWAAYKDYTTVTPFNKNIDPFQLDRTWHVVIDGDPPEWNIA
jgi:hypothetical protein